jgi:hypothetical protein
MNAAFVAVACEIARCGHASFERSIPGGVLWCVRCGAVRLGVGGWFRPSGAGALARVLGPELSLRAQRLYDHVFEEGPFACALSELVAAFGMAPVLELVQADRLTLDDEGRAVAVRPASDPEDPEPPTVDRPFGEASL